MADLGVVSKRLGQRNMLRPLCTTPCSHPVSHTNVCSGVFIAGIGECQEKFVKRSQY